MSLLGVYKQKIKERSCPTYCVIRGEKKKALIVNQVEIVTDARHSFTGTGLLLVPLGSNRHNDPFFIGNLIY